MNKFCQSCAMPLDLRGKDMRGTEADGSPSNLYCEYCYQKGAWTDANITMDEMLVKGKAGIDSGEGSAFSKWLIKLMYPMQLKGLSRWKNSAQK